MGARFGDLLGYFSPGLELPVKGTVYIVPLPSAELGLWCRGVMQLAGEAADVDENSTETELAAAAERARERAADLPPLPGGGKRSFERLFLGDVLDEMIRDKVEHPYIQMCAETAYIWVTLGCGEAAEERARAYWVSGGRRPEAQGPGNRASRRAAGRAGGTSTAVVDGTPSAASTSGTSTHQRSSGSGRRRRSRGRRS